MNKLVAKEPRYEIPYKERLKFHIESDLCQTVSSEHSMDFNLENVMGKGPSGLAAPCRVDFIES